LYVLLAAALGPLAVVFALIEWRIRHRERKDRDLRAQAERLGLDSPISLHPHVDPNRCIGSGACVAACSVRHVLGLRDLQAHLTRGSACVGHGACAAACPMEAISLVFGTARRGIDIPRVSPDFESSVPGVFVAGEVGGMGLIRNAVEQGRQAANAAIASLAGLPRAPEGVRDLIIVGGGPAGISAARAAHAAGVDALVCEQDDPGGAILSYPRGKIILTRPIEMPGMPVVKGPRLSKEQLMDFIEGAAADLDVRTRARVADVQPDGEHLRVELADGEVLTTRRVLISVGRRGTPAKLGVPGEELGAVIYTLREPERLAGQAVLVVGGGNSAVESALLLSEQPGTAVQLSYRGDVFHRVAPETRERLDAAVAAGRIALYLGTEVTRIDFGAVALDGPEGTRTVPADTVLVQIGGTLPTAFLHRIGLLVDVHHGKRIVRAATQPAI
ncbi:MAG: NAD(P)-binding domain-containing protein, partial [Myxococcales bacterium]|nr:NAD(P)-binding domain-containing protein [Myxococcales bacterium]